METDGLSGGGGVDVGSVVKLGLLVLAAAVVYFRVL